MPVVALLILTATLLAGRILQAADVAIVPGDTRGIPRNQWPAIAALRGQPAFMSAVDSAPGLARLKWIAHDKMRKEIVTQLHEHLFTGKAQDSEVAHLIGKEQWDTRQTLLHWAASEGETEIVQFLLSAPGVTANVVDGTHGRAPLHCASRQGQRPTMELLLAARGIQVNARDWKQRTPLHLAVISGQDDAVMALVNADSIDVTAVDEDGKSPLQHAMEGWRRAKPSSARQHIIKVLIRFGAGFGPMSDVTPLYWAVHHDHSDIVELLLKMEGVDVNEGGGNQPLCEAVMQDRPHLVTMLLEHENIDVNAGHPLLLAVQIRHLRIARMLAQHPRLDVTSQGFQQALQMAERYGYTQLVSLMNDRCSRRKLSRSLTSGLFKNPCFSMDSVHDVHRPAQ
ncbi:hypothetical protein PBRA_007855 [Plasmodiophora brassicae]|nr:hypothetical protein PBRA_007855 [Plasmodiophora brassicae]